MDWLLDLAWTGATVVFLILAALVLAGVVIGLIQRDHGREIDAIIGRHADTLHRARRRLLAVDEYGVVRSAQQAKWEAEKAHFIEAVIRATLERRHPGKTIALDAAEVGGRIDARLDALQDAPDESPEPRAAAMGAEYEHRCAALLERHGWSARVTPVGGDQGADIIAERGGVRIVLQCKFHRAAVGNKAVQEVVAARNVVGASKAFVVSNSSFTRSAKELALLNDVRLIHHDELGDL
jgi:restriction system protein